MTGRKQHFIPRHFLKGFVISDKRDKHWLYRRGLSEPKEVSRNDAAAQNYFYSKPNTVGLPTLDHLITEYEQKLQSHVGKVRTIPVGNILPADLMREIVVHLTIRSAYFRESINAGIDTLVCHLAEFFKSMELPKYHISSEFETLLIKEVENYMPYLPINITPRTIARLIYQIIRENYGDFQKEIFTSLELLQEKFQEIDKNVQTQVLEEDMVPLYRKSMLEKFQWRVVDFPSGNAILPDCVAIAEDADGWGSYILGCTKSMSRVVIPLTSSKLAIGTIANDWEKIKEIYNKTARESCFTFYLTNQKEKVSENQISEIGNIVRKKISSIASSKLDGIGEDFIIGNSSMIHEETHPVTWTDLLIDKKFSYSVSFKNCRGKDYTLKAAKAFCETVKDFSKYLPLYRFDGITFVPDIAAELQEIDQEFNPFGNTFFNDSAMPYLVRCPDGIKTHIFVKDSLAEQWISEGKTLCGNVIIYKCLAISAFNALFESKFPDKFFAPYDDPYENWLYRCNITLLPIYFSNYFLVADVETLGFYSKQANLKLKKMISVTADAHALYQKDKDHERFFTSCVIHVSNFMTAMAIFLAARASMGDQQQPDQLLDQTLVRCNLSNWEKCFGEDLDVFSRSLDNWVNIDEMLFLNRHFERLLIEVGVIAGHIKSDRFHFHAFNNYRLSSLILP